MRRRKRGRRPSKPLTARSDGAHLVTRRRGVVPEGPGAAAEDVDRGRLGECAHVREAEEPVRRHAAGNDPPLPLCVDIQVRVGVF